MSFALQVHPPPRSYPSEWWRDQKIAAVSTAGFLESDVGRLMPRDKTKNRLVTPECFNLESRTQALPNFRSHSGFRQNPMHWIPAFAGMTTALDAAGFTNGCKKM